MKNMQTAIICPRYTLNSETIRILREKTDGSVLKILGGRMHADLTKYDLIILVYQYPLSPMNGDFIEFYEENKEALMHARLVIDLPASLIEDNASGIPKELEGLIDRIGRTDITVESVALVNTNCTTEQKQKRYADSLGIGYKSIFDGRTIADNPAVVTIFTPSAFDMKISRRRACLYMIAGVCAVPLGVILFYFGLVVLHNSRLTGASFSLVGGGPLLLYMAYRSKKFAEWRGD